MDIYTTEYIRIPLSNFIRNFMDIETAALARAYLGIGSGTGSVTNTGTLTLHAIVVGNGTVDVKALSGLGTVGQVLTSNGAGADPSFQPAASGTGNVTTAVTLTDHGVVLGNGTVDVAVTAVGTTNTLLHGNTGADPTFSAVVEADISLTDLTTANVTSAKHGFAPKSPGSATQFLNGAATPAFAAVKDSDLSTSDITTNNVSISKHGFAPKSPNDATKYLDGTGAYSVPVGSGTGITELTGDVTAGPGSGSEAATIANDAVTYAKIQNVSAASKLLGRGDSGSGDVQEITLGTNLSMSGTTLNASGGGGGSGTVTNTGTLVDHGLCVGNGGVDISTLAVGANNTVLHGVTGADPAFSAVVEADLGLTDVTTANAATGQHGFLKKLSNISTEYMDGTGNWSVPAGSGGGDDWETTVEARITSQGSSTTLITALGCQLATSGNANTASAATSLQLDCANVATNVSTLGAIAFIGSSNANPGGNYLVGRASTWVAKVTPIDSTNARYWFGVTNLIGSGVGSQAASDLPTANYACFRYSSSASDTNWQAVVGDGSSTEVIDTGVPVSNTTMVRLAITWDGSASNSFKFYINGALVATGTLNPAAATLFKMTNSVTIVTAGGATKSYRLAEAKIRVTL